MERPQGYGDYGDTEGEGPWGGRWNRGDDGDRWSGSRSHNAPSSSASRGGYGARRPSPAAAAKASPRPAGAPGEIVVHYDADPGCEGGGLQIRDKLRHAQFGVGEVRGWQSAGADMKVTMKFPTVGVKTILARFLTRP